MATSDASKLGMSSVQEALVKGAKVWVAVDALTWQLGELKSSATAHDDPAAAAKDKGKDKGSKGGASAPTVQVHLEEERGRGKTITAEVTKLAPSNPKLQEGIPDLTHLSFLNEPGILYNLKYRYGHDQIYTFAGPVLIALNPCKLLPLYTPSVASQYKAAARDTIHMLDPHIYLVAANAFRKMLREKTSQSLIVNGESGAGKTETTKKAMQYFATLAGGTGIEDQVLETNPVLEAFGNAKTLRNHNSSRFGKLIQIHFNQSNRICGACIKTYLLEKSRVTHQLQGERSYHILYQLVRGASQQQREGLKLPKEPQAFRYLSQSGCTSIDGVDDAAEFRVVCKAMTDIGIKTEDQEAVFALLAGVLWLGNVELLPKHDSNDSTVVENNEALDNTCTLLGLDKVHLCSALTQKRIITPHEIVTKLLNVDEAREARDALAKATYSAIFNWIVDQINAKLDTAKRSSGHSISILDIYGFEQFKVNSFEQLCINYANERLQQQFTRHLFTLEQQEYESEGIDWTKIEFTDNQDCVDVIEMHPPKGLGVLSVLDSQCKFPKATDSTLAIKLKEALASNSHFGVNPRAPNDFIIAHYAGQVEYNTAGFLDKNKDTLSGDLMEVMASSRHALLPQLGASIRDEVENKRGGGQTVGGRFSVQLRELIAELDTTGLHFVRCIKPNAALAPNHFEAHMTLHQLRCCGVLEVARVARAGFPTRYSHAQFVARYALLLGPEDQAAMVAEEEEAEGGEGGAAGGARRACMLLLDKFQLKADHYQVGKTKIFFRAGVLGFVEDRWARMQSSALRIQTAWRMHVHRAAFLALRAVALTLQACWRAKRVRVAYELYKRQQKAALVIQTLWRGYCQRSRFTAMQQAAVLIQMSYRRYCFRKGVRRREYERRLVERAAKAEQESFVALRKEYGVEMSEVRSSLAVWAVCRSRGLLTAEQVSSKLDQVGTLQAAAAASRAASLLSPRPSMGAPLPVAAEELHLAAQQQQQQQLEDAGGVALMLVVVRDEGDKAEQQAAAPPQPLPPPPQPMGFERVQELHVELERSRLERAKLAKELHAQKMLKERDNVKAAEAQAKMLTMIRELQLYVAVVKGEYAKHHLQLPPLPTALMAGNYPTAVAAPAAAPAAPAAPAAAAAPADAAAAAPPSTLGAAAAAGTPFGAAAAVPMAAAAAATAAGASSSSGAGTLPNGHVGAGGGSSGGEAGEAGPRGGAAVAGAAAAVARAPASSSGQAAVASPRGTSRPGAVASPRGTSRPGAVDASRYVMHADWEEESNVASPQRGPPRPSLSPFAAEAGVAPGASPAAAAAATRRSNPGGQPPATVLAGTNLASPALPLPPGARPSSPHVGHSRIPHVHGGPESPAGSESGRASPRVARAPLPPAAAAPKPQSSSLKYVNQLKGDLDKVSQVLNDDVDFIMEVHQGVVQAPEMDPAYELMKLKKKFEIWKKDFKDKLGTTEEVLKKLERMGQAPGPGPGPGAGQRSSLGGGGGPSGMSAGAGPPGRASSRPGVSGPGGGPQGAQKSKGLMGLFK